MYQITNISNDANQSINFILPDREDVGKLTLRYVARLQSWYMDVSWEDFEINNKRVCSHPNLLIQWKKIIPFGLACYTLDNSDPYFVDDFQNKRCGLFLLSDSDVDLMDDYFVQQKEK